MNSVEMTSSPMSFLCDAIYRGSEVVEGAVSSNTLTALAENVLSNEGSMKNSGQLGIEKVSRGERCQLQVDEERLRVSTTRRDEGFESDSESASTASGSLSDEALCASPEIKVIEDHVLRLEKLIRKDSGIKLCASQSFEDGGSSYVNSSSGAESEEEMPRHLQILGTKSTMTNSNQMSYRDNKLQGENGTKDYFLLSDILFCHVMSHRPRIVIVVVKSVDTLVITAHLFECLTQEAAKTLYSCYYTASNKFKLSRYRINKRRNENNSEDKALLDRIHVSIRNIRRKSSEVPRKTDTSLNHNYTNKFNPSNQENEEQINFDECLSGQNGNVNVIEVKDPNIRKDSNGVMQRTDENGVTHIEIGDDPSVSMNDFQEMGNGEPKSMFDCEQVLSALERLSIHSSNNPDSYLNYVGVTSSCPNSLIQTSREIHATRESEKERRLRQRQPPLLLKKEPSRKMDSLPKKEIRRRVERRNRSRSDEREGFNESRNSSLFDISSSEVEAENSIKYQDSSTEILGKEALRDKLTSNETKSTQMERPSRSRTTIKDDDERRRPHSNHTKGLAPPPPPRKHPKDPSIMLVATKSGQENSRSFYPKESHIVRGTKLVRIDYPLYPPWNMNSDINNNPKRLYYALPSWVGSHEYHANRHASVSFSELHKRSRSKSPARRPAANRYIDAVSTFNISQKLKDLSDSVIQSLRNSAPGMSASFDNLNRAAQDRISSRVDRKKLPLSNLKPLKDDTLRPVIKRGKRVDNFSDPRRVTFSAYATVQVMD